MQANSPSAFLLSFTLHGLVVALILVFAYVLNQPEKESPKVFELVAGAGNNYAATEAPPPSAANTIKFAPPKAPAPEIRPEPIPEIVPEKVVAPTPKLIPPKKVIVKPKPKPKPKKVTPKPKPRKMTKAEFDRLNANKRRPAPKQSQPKQIKVRTIDANSFANVSSKTLTGAGGKALTREEGRLLDSYIALLKQRLRSAHQKPQGLSDLLKAMVRFRIGSDGVLSSVKIVKSSGSDEFDQSVLRAFAKVRTIGRPPHGKSDVWTLTFRMREDV